MKQRCFKRETSDFNETQNDVLVIKYAWPWHWEVQNQEICQGKKLYILLALVPANMVGKSWSDLYSNRLGQAWLRLKKLHQIYLKNKVDVKFE